MKCKIAKSMQGDKFLLTAETNEENEAINSIINILLDAREDQNENFGHGTDGEGKPRNFVYIPVLEIKDEAE